MGWPGFDDKLTTEDRIALQKDSYLSKLKLVFEYPAIGVGKVVVSLWKVFLYLLFLLALIVCIKGKKIRNRLNVIGNFIYFSVKYIYRLTKPCRSTIFLLQMPIIELGTMYVLAT